MKSLKGHDDVDMIKLDVDMMPKLNKHSLNNSTICEALPFLVLLFVRHVVIVSFSFPYPKCHDVK